MICVFRESTLCIFPIAGYETGARLQPGCGFGCSRPFQKIPLLQLDVSFSPAATTLSIFLQNVSTSKLTCLFCGIFAVFIVCTGLY